MSKLKNIQIAESEGNSCSGWRYAKDCPHEGVYQKDNPACKDCYEDAMVAMHEQMMESIKEL